MCSTNSRKPYLSRSLAPTDNLDRQTYIQNIVVWLKSNRNQTVTIFWYRPTRIRNVLCDFAHAQRSQKHKKNFPTLLHLSMRTNGSLLPLSIGQTVAEGEMPRNVTFEFTSGSGRAAIGSSNEGAAFAGGSMDLVSWLLAIGQWTASDEGFNNLLIFVACRSPYEIKVHSN